MVRQKSRAPFCISQQNAAHPARAVAAHANGAGQCTVPADIGASGAIVGMPTRRRDGINSVTVTPPTASPGATVQIKVAGSSFVGLLGAVYAGDVKVGSHSAPVGGKLCGGSADAVTHSAPLSAGTSSLVWNFTLPAIASGSLEIRVITLVGAVGASDQKFAIGKALLAVRAAATTTTRDIATAATTSLAIGSTTAPFCPYDLGAPNRTSPCGHGCTYDCANFACVLRLSGNSTWQVACTPRSLQPTPAITSVATPVPRTVSGNPNDFELNGDKFSVVYRKSSICRSGGAVAPIGMPEPTAWNSTWINWGTQTRTTSPTAQLLSWARVVVATTVANTDTEWKSSLSLVLDLSKGQMKESETWLSTGSSTSKLFVFTTPDVCATFRKLQSLSANAAQRLSLGGADMVERSEKFQFRVDDEDEPTTSSVASRLCSLESIVFAVAARVLFFTEN
jgi:hypothetical protein